MTNYRANEKAEHDEGSNDRKRQEKYDAEKRFAH